MFTVITVLNPLTGGETRKEYRWEKGKSLSHYLEYEGRAVVTWGQSIIDLPLSEIFPARKEIYTVLAVPEGVDKGTFNAVLGMALTGLSIATGMYPALAGTKFATWGYRGLIVLGMAGNMFLRDKKEDQSMSQSYSWRHISSSTAAFGSAMPIVYGKARVRPTIKNRYIAVDGDLQTLYALFGVTGHLVDELNTIEAPRWNPQVTWDVNDIVRPIVDEDNPDEPGKTYRCLRQNRAIFYNSEEARKGAYWEIGRGSASFSEDVYVNGRAIGDYNRDVRWETRPGLAQQVFIDGFDVTYTNYAQDESLYLSMPFVNRVEAQITFSPQQNILSWARHVLFYGGTTYTIQVEATPLMADAVRYLIWRPSASTTQYLTTGAPLSTDHVIATINTGTGVITYPSLSVEDVDWFTPSVPFTNTHNIELILELPNGLYGRNPSGSLISARCGFFAQYRVRGTDHWSNFAYSYSNSLYVESFMDNTLTGGLISRKTTKPIAISIKALPDDEYLDPNTTYEIRITAATPIQVTLINIATLIYGDENADENWPGFTYPGEALLGIRALASGQINSDLDVQVDVERSSVWVYNTRSSEWVEADANIHAWAVYDILAQGHPDHPAYPTAGNEDAEAIYGCGVDKDRIDYESFRTWAEYTGGSDEGELDYELNIVFDAFLTAWDAILRICQEGRGMVYPIGGKLYAFTDKAETVSQIFTMGSIHTDTFVQKYVESKQQVNMIEADYFDRDRNYEKTSIAVRTSDWDSSTDISVPSKITLYGTDTFDQAWSIIRYMLRGVELLDNTIVFSVDIDSLASQVGDVVGIQHSITDAGISCGGRVVSAAAISPNDTVVIDQEFTLEANVLYTMEVKHRNGTLETNNIVVVGVDTTTSTMTFTNDWATLPVPYLPFTVFKVSEALKKYRITAISRNTELMRTLTLMQYDADVYESWAPADGAKTTDSGEFTSAKIPVGGDPWTTALAALFNGAYNLQLQETVSRNRVSGEYESSVIARWDTTNGDPRGEWEVWFRDVDVSDIDWYGEWLQGSVYNYGHKVEHDGYTFISVVDNNVGSRPVYR